MRQRTKTGVGLGAVVVAVLAIGGCGGAQGQGGAERAGASAGTRSSGATAGATPAPVSSAPATPTTPADRLAALDGGTRPAAQYQDVLGALAPRCSEDPAHLAGIIGSTLSDLKKHGAGEEDAFGVLQHLEQSVPAGGKPVACEKAAAKYAASREAN
ncbi:hypothetical protein KUM39_08335 [Streptomyces sp. J2-1]|uniref:hypothetical protein n=1 Tax=Streptomyces corallincola TaxID=2851888 RepID=UPI001C383C16|nr:hypothetical protein [Streptomyces corallincola]MBV2354371.1 hypothetical protein [Streptomyces corallincola]